MQPYQTPTEAKSALLSVIFEQAAIDGISLTEFERKLLRSVETDPTPTEEEIENFDDEQGDESWDKIASLIRNAKTRFRRDGGREAESELKACITIAARKNGYLGEILFLRGFASLYGESLSKNTLQIIGASVIGGAALVYGLFFLLDHNPQRWIDAHTKPLQRASDWVSLHTLWMSNPYGWFQQYAGYVAFAALFAYAIYAYGSMLRDHFRRR
ncbi:MAG: hypothetical protein JWO13_2913 [Acidobacteriales bacterium]|nr:hypothetical protein [Terriglobales bacterium]